MKLTFIPDRRGAGRYRETPDFIGTLFRSGRGKNLQAILPIPADMLASVLTMLVGGRLHYASFEGEVLSKGGAEIRRYGFQRALMDDDLPPEGEIPKGTLGIW